MKRAFVMLAVGNACAGSTDFGSDVAVTSEEQLLVVRDAASISIARGSTNDTALMSAVVNDRTPRSFTWVMLTIDEQQSNAVRGMGLSVDMSTRAGVTFSQVWRGLCNPSTGDFSSCYLFESYQAGEPGLSGTVSVVVGDVEVHAAYDITWEGQTDRYGEPSYFKHGSSGGFSGDYLGIE